ncbi:MAG: M28 family peptidase [Oscillospiraceae bacterium]|nr:M28 family peptidase [Oscillospiraceae bacterium]
MVCGKREFELLHKINFIRTCGTEEEKQAAQILADEVRSIGAEPTIESFDVDRWDIKKVSLVTDGREWEVTGYGLSGSTPEEGITAPFAYVQDATDVDLVGVKGKIVMVNGRVGDVLYKKLIKAGVLAFITFEGNIIDKREESDLDTRNLRDWAIKEGKIPGVNMRTMDAHELVKSNPKMATLTLIQDEGLTTSQNVVASIEGSDSNGETIVFGAHYDSVPFSHGVYDNGAGSVIIMELLRYFKEHQPKRNMTFCWFGSEERGLCGSKAYVATHQNELKDVALMVNVDIAGPVLGKDEALITGDDSLRVFVDYLGKEIGFPITAKQDIYSSDSIPFADNGVPGINFYRSGAPGGANIHNRHDIIESLDWPNLENSTQFILTFAERLANAVVFPVPRALPQNIVEKVDKYLKKPEKK